MSYPTFEKFFLAVHGFEPYTWQKQLAEQVAANGCLPRQISVPTGLGKTATIDILVWALGHQIATGTRRTLGQRIIVAVERQVIVDGISQHVQRLVKKVNDDDSEILTPVRDALKTLRLDGDKAIRQTSFHGSRHDHGDWLDITGVTIIATTVTQVTLRLLGRSPATSRSLAPVHAALVAKDATILIDEPQLVLPQVHAIRKLLSFEDGLSQICVMGATIQSGVTDKDSTFAFSESSETSQAFERIQNPKPVSVTVTDDSFVDRAVALVKEEVLRDESLAIGIIANTIDAARAIAKKLETPAHKAHYSLRVLTGHSRGFERPEPSEIGVKGEILVATQTVEAGVDFSLDLLVTDVCPIPNLLQRLGRLNRTGESQCPHCYVVIPRKGDNLGTKETRGIYGDSVLDSTTAGLSKLSGVTNWAVANQTKLVEDVAAKGNCEPKDLWPEVAEPIDCDERIVQEFLGSTTHGGGDTSAFLRGLDHRDEFHVHLCWRSTRRIPSKVIEDLKFSVSTLFPSSAETISVPITEARSLLKNRPFITQRDSQWVEILPRNVVPGQLIVVDSAEGGLDKWGFNPKSFADVRDLSLAIVLRDKRGMKNRRAFLTQDSLLGAFGKPNSDFTEAMMDLESVEASGAELAKELSAQLSQLTETPLKVSYKQGRFVAQKTAPTVTNSTIVPLNAHLAQVGSITDSYCNLLEIPDLQDDLRTAAFYHDFGKANRSFQAFFGRLDSDPLLAKSSGRVTRVQDSTGRFYLHELASAKAIGENQLAKWLVLAHHGRFRGVFSKRWDTVYATEMRSSLEDRYGVYGLTWIETILRCADWRASAAPDNSFMLPDHVGEALAECENCSDDFTVRPPDQTSQLPGLSGADLPSWYSVAGLMAALDYCGKSAQIRWVNGIPEINATLDTIEASITRFLPKLEGDRATVDLRLGDYSKDHLDCKNQKLRITPNSLKELWRGLGSDNLLSSLFAPWLQSFDGSEKWSLILPFFSANSNVIPSEKPDVSRIMKCLADLSFDRREAPSSDNMNLNGYSVIQRPSLAPLIFTGGLVALPITVHSLGATAKNFRRLPHPHQWVSLEELVALTNASTLNQLPRMVTIQGETNGEKALKTTPAYYMDTLVE